MLFAAAPAFDSTHGRRSQTKRRARWQPYLENLEPREAPAIDFTQTGIDTLFSGKGWITYSPAEGASASQATVEADFARIRAAGFVGVVTYASHTGDITGMFPKLAYCAGLRVIAGLDLASDVNQTNLNRINPYSDAYVVGNETIKTGTTPAQLATLIGQVKSWTNKPATTAEEYGNYDMINNPTIAQQVLKLGDWVFPNIQVWFDGFVSQCIDRGVIQGPTLFNNIVTYSNQSGLGNPVVAHEFWWPTAAPNGQSDPCGNGSGPGATPANQSTYFSGSVAYSASHFGGNLRIVWGEYIDQTWKGTSVESHFGWWTTADSPKPVVSNLASQYQDFAHQIPIPMCPAPFAGMVVSGSIKTFDATTGALLHELDPFPGFDGEVRLARGDINGDSFPDMVAGAGVGGGPHVRVFDGKDARELSSFLAFDPRFTGGIFVAAADVNNDGFDDVVVGAGAGGGPHVKVFSGRDGQVLFSFFAYAPTFAGGVNVAAGDTNADGNADVITGAGPGGGPHVKVFSGANGALIQSYFAYDPAFHGGVFVAAVDVNHDGTEDVVTGAGAGGGPHVKVFSGPDASLLRSFLAFDSLFRGGVRVGAVDWDENGDDELLLGAGPGAGPHVRVSNEESMDVLDQFFAREPSDTQYRDGVFVALG